MSRINYDGLPDKIDTFRETHSSLPILKLSVFLCVISVFKRLYIVGCYFHLYDRKEWTLCGFSLNTSEGLVVHITVTRAAPGAGVLLCRLSII